MLAELNFYDEKVIITLPSSFMEFKLNIAEKFLIELDDVNELLISSENLKITNEEEYQQLLSLKKRISIKIEISENSKIYQNEKKNMLEEKMDNIKKKWNNLEIGKKFEDITNQFKEKFQNLVKLNEVKKDDKKEEKKDKEEKKNEKKEELITHYRVKCDGCKKFPIEGIRYKCTICKNFDYCEECEKKYALKHGHPLLKIRKPELTPISIICKMDK
jgi:hypothetical protein